MADVKVTPPPNGLTVRIAEDGKIKIDTGNFRGDAHAIAERFLQVLQSELGVTVESKATTAHGHVHTHADGTTHHNH